MPPLHLLRVARRTAPNPNPNPNPNANPNPNPHRVDGRIFEASDGAKKAARRPHLWILVRKGDSMSELTHVLRARFEDTQTLNTPMHVRGMPVHVTIRWITGDLILLQRCSGIHSSGGARYRCPFCMAGCERCAPALV